MKVSSAKEHMLRAPDVKGIKEFWQICSNSHSTLKGGYIHFTKSTDLITIAMTSLHQSSCCTASQIQCLLPGAGR
jgi:hypothetical protein